MGTTDESTLDDNGCSRHVVYDHVSIEGSAPSESPTRARHGALPDSLGFLSTGWGFNLSSAVRNRDIGLYQREPRCRMLVVAQVRVTPLEAS